MLYPDFNELIQLGARSARLGYKTKRKTTAAHAGDYASPFRGQGLEFQEAREYQPGDDVRNIDWRVTARMNRPYLKIFTEERERTVIFCIDANASMRFGTRGTFKSVQAARATAMLGWMAQAAGDKIGATVFGDVEKGLQFFAPLRGRRALWQTLKLLSTKSNGKSTHETPLEDALISLSRAAPTGALVFVISDFAYLTEEIEKHFSSLRRRCDVLLVRINDPSDKDLPPMDSVWFSGNDNKRILASTGSKEGRETYRRQWEENRRRLDDTARRQGMKIIDLQTNADIFSDITNSMRFIDMQKRRRP